MKKDALVQLNDRRFRLSRTNFAADILEPRKQTLLEIEIAPVKK